MDEPTIRAEAVAGPPVWEDFLDIFYAPGAVFERRRDGRFGLALAFVVLAVVVLFAATQSVLGPVYDAEMMRAQAQFGDGQSMTPEQLAQMRRFSGIFAVVGMGIGFPIAIVLLAAVIWAVGRLVDATLPVALAFVVSTYSQFPRILQQLSAVVQGLVLDTRAMRSQHDVALGPARLLDVDAADPVLVALATRFDPFVLWVTVLMAIGLYVLGRTSKARAALGAVLVWAIASIPPLLAAIGASRAGG